MECTYESHRHSLLRVVFSSQPTRSKPWDRGALPKRWAPGPPCGTFLCVIWQGKTLTLQTDEQVGPKGVKGDIRTHCCRFVRMLIECLNFYIFCLVIKSQMFSLMCVRIRYFKSLWGPRNITAFCLICLSLLPQTKSIKHTHTQTTLHMDGQNLANPPGLYLNNRNQHITLYLKKTLYE